MAEMEVLAEALRQARCFVEIHKLALEKAITAHDKAREAVSAAYSKENIARRKLLNHVLGTNQEEEHNG